MTDPLVFKKLKKLVGKDKVFLQPEYLSSYAFDATQQTYQPEAVVIPTEEIDIKNTIDFANKYNIPIVPRGAGVGYSGGAVPIFGGIVISFTKMDKILEIDEENMIAEVQPGVITGELIQACQEKNLFYPPILPA